MHSVICESGNDSNHIMTLWIYQCTLSFFKINIIIIIIIIIRPFLTYIFFCKSNRIMHILPSLFFVSLLYSVDIV